MGNVVTYVKTDPLNYPGSSGVNQPSLTTACDVHPPNVAKPTNQTNKVRKHEMRAQAIAMACSVL